MALDDHGSDENDDSTGKRPVLTNNDEGCAAWVHTDKNNDPYLSVSLPFGLSVNLFPENENVIMALNHVLERQTTGEQ